MSERLPCAEHCLSILREWVLAQRNDLTRECWKQHYAHFDVCEHPHCMLLRKVMNQLDIPFDMNGNAPGVNARSSHSITCEAQ